MAKECAECGKKIPFLSTWARDFDGERYEFCSYECLHTGNERWVAEHPDSPEAKLRETTAEKEVAAQEIQREFDSIVITTAHSLPGDPNYEVIEIITSECVEGMNVFRDMFAGVRDIVGGRSEASQKMLRNIRQTCLHELRREAHAVGADAVIGVDLDYSEFSGGRKSMLFLVASGTAIKYKESVDRRVPPQ